MDRSLSRNDEEKQRAEEESKANEGVAESEKKTYVAGNLYSFIQRLHSEFNKSLKHIDPHSPVGLFSARSWTDMLVY